MGQWVHRLSDVDNATMTAVCTECGPIGVYRAGSGVRCATAKTAETLKAYHAGRRGQNGRRRLAVERGRCERCGFLPVDVCQLDVDHIDGDYTNNDPGNLQVLCANCHRLKTYRPEKALLRA